MAFFTGHGEARPSPGVRFPPELPHLLRTESPTAAREVGAGFPDSSLKTSFTWNEILLARLFSFHFAVPLPGDRSKSLVPGSSKVHWWHRKQAVR